MNILVIGNGGREHALAWKMKQSPLCEKIYVAPGNAGTASVAENVSISVDDFNMLGQFCQDKAIGLVVVGPEGPLVNGIRDYFEGNPALQKVLMVGPGKEGARLEGSKDYSKQFMLRNNIPTAKARTFSAGDLVQALDYISECKPPIVLKADGLAAGKGVIISLNQGEAKAVIKEMLVNKRFGAASSKVLIEEFLNGIELSVFVLTDGKDYVLLPEAKDYKRIGMKDTGLNTGGMGAVSPVPFADAAFMKKIEEKVIKPTVQGLEKEAIDYKGFIFFGLIKVGDEPYVIEYNCRMGDPETEVVVPRLKNDLLELFQATVDGKLSDIKIKKDDRFACTVMAVSGGYPGSYEKGFAINGLNEPLPADSLVFHAGTSLKDGEVITNGGRVLAVTSFSDSISTAVLKSKQVLKHINFDGMYYRHDIGFEFE
jgi:phosphoribosylamine--glycine ligase